MALRKQTSLWFSLPYCGASALYEEHSNTCASLLFLAFGYLMLKPSTSNRLPTSSLGVLSILQGYSYVIKSAFTFLNGPPVKSNLDIERPVTEPPSPSLKATQVRIGFLFFVSLVIRGEFNRFELYGNANESITRMSLAILTSVSVVLPHEFRDSTNNHTMRKCGW